MHEINRRRFIYGSFSALGIGSSLSFLNACGVAGISTSQSSPDDIQLVQRFPQILVPGEVRLPISLAQSSGIIRASGDFKFPESLTAKIFDLSNDAVITENVSVSLHGLEISLPYYPFRTKIEKPGNYSLVVEGGPVDGAAFSVLERDQVLVPKIGDDLPAFDTPTFDNARQVASICTRLPEPCSFHQITLTAALQRNMPIAYMIATPSHCSTGTCTPASEQLIKVGKSVGDRAIFIHTEVYADDAATTIAPAVKALNLNFEPTLLVADANGKIVDRLDAVFDEKEIFEALARAGVK